MFRTMLVAVIVLEFAAAAAAQQPRTEWARFFDDPAYEYVTPTDIHVDTTGSVYLAATGRSISSGDYDILFSKFDSRGQALWTKYYAGPGTGEDQSRDLFIDGFGDFYLTAWYQAGQISCVEVLKYSPNGDLIWAKQLPETCGLNMWVFEWECDADGNLYLCGKTGSQAEDWLVAKVFSDGSIAWLRNLTGLPDDMEQARGLSVDVQGSVYATGLATSGNNASVVTIKYSAAGSELWRRTFATLAASSDAGNAVVVDHDGNAVVIGQTAVTVSPFDIDYLVIKYDPDGDTLWVRRFGGTAGLNDFPLKARIDSQNNIVIAGIVRLGEYGIGDWAVLKYSPSGELLWQNIYDGATHESDSPGDLMVTANDDIVAVGTIDRSDTFDTGDLLLRKYAADGTVWWDKKYFGIGNSFELCESLAGDVLGGWIVAGWSSDGSSSHRAYLNKYSDYTCGDADGSGIVTISDAVYLINYIFSGGPAPNPLLAGDADCSGSITISDAVYMINYIFSGGPAPCAACP